MASLPSVFGKIEHPEIAHPLSRCYLNCVQGNLNVYQFTDYRAYLVAHAKSMKCDRRQWTFGTWARALGLKSTSSLTKILQGERHPGPDMTERFVKYFRLPDSKARYLRDLIQIEKLRKDPHLSALVMQRLSDAGTQTPAKVLDFKTFELISGWQHLALREFTRVQGFKEDPDWIRKQLHFKITSKEIRKAIDTLIACGLLERMKDGTLARSERRVITSDDIASEAIKNYHEKMLEHAHQAVRKFSVSERELTSTTIAIRPEKLPQARELIRDFKAKFEQLIEAQDGDNAFQVYQVQLQFFPLTKLLPNVKIESSEK